MFNNLPSATKDPIFEVFSQYSADPNPKKVNLGIGIYTDKDNKPFVFPSIQKAVAELDINNFNYQPIPGDPKFLEITAKLNLGDDFDLSSLSMQSTCGGTNACRIFADLMIRAGKNKILYGLPTWVNHPGLFKSLEITTFPHLNEQHEVEFSNYKKAVQEADNGSILLLQGSQTHNPIGKNITTEQVRELIPLINKKDMIIFIDMAYLGMGDGIEEDRKMTQAIFKECKFCAIGASYSKNASLYEHRTGALIIKNDIKDLVTANLKNIMRESVSNPPGFGIETVVHLFENHYNQWRKELEEVRLEILKAREDFVNALPQFEHARTGRGMFGLLHISPEQINRLRDEFSIYLLGSSRINFSGLKKSNFDYTIEGFKKVLK